MGKSRKKKKNVQMRGLGEQETQEEENRGFPAMKDDRGKAGAGESTHLQV